MTDDKPNTLHLDTWNTLNVNNRVLFTITDDGHMTLGEGVTPDEAAREFVELVNTRARAAMEIVQAVATIRETGTWDSSQPYDAQISALTIHKARALLGMKEATER